MFTQENADDIPSLETRNISSSLTHVAIIVDVVWKQLCKLKPYKSGGPDNCCKMRLDNDNACSLSMANQYNNNKRA